MCMMEPRAEQAEPTVLRHVAHEVRSACEYEASARGSKYRIGLADKVDMHSSWTDLLLLSTLPIDHPKIPPS